MLYCWHCVGGSVRLLLWLGGISRLVLCYISHLSLSVPALPRPGPATHGQPALLYNNPVLHSSLLQRYNRSPGSPGSPLTSSATTLLTTHNNDVQHPVLVREIMVINKLPSRLLKDGFFITNPKSRVWSQVSQSSFEPVRPVKHTLCFMYPLWIVVSN